MEGPKREDGSLDTETSDCGIIARAVNHVFKALEARAEGVAAGDNHVKISFLEIYNEVRASRCLPPALTPPHARAPVSVPSRCTPHRHLPPSSLHGPRPAHLTSLPPAAPG